MYVAGARIHLPYTDVIKEKGDEVSLQELADAQQGEEEIANLVDGGALLSPEGYQALLVQEAREARKAEAEALRAQADSLEEEAGA